MDGVLAWSASVMMFKQVVCHMACARERVKHDLPVFPKEATNIIAVIGKPILGLGPTFGAGEFVTKCERTSANNAQNEPFMLMACFCLNAAGALPAKGSEALVAYTYCRIFHNVSMFLKIGTLRTAAYLTGQALVLYCVSGAITGV